MIENNPPPFHLCTDLKRQEQLSPCQHTSTVGGELNTAAPGMHHKAVL